jgi:hypothetical protein
MVECALRRLQVANFLAEIRSRRAVSPRGVRDLAGTGARPRLSRESWATSGPRATGSRSEEHRLPHARLATCSCAALRKATTPASACCSCQPRSPGGDVLPCCLPMAVPPRRRQLAQPPCGPSTSTSARGPPRTRPPGAPGSPLPGYPRRPAALRQGQGPPTGSAARAHPYPGFGPAHTRPGLP